MFFTPYISTDGVSAVRSDEMAVEVLFFPADQPERFHHVAKAISAAFSDESSFRCQLTKMMADDLPKEVLRRKVSRFIKEGRGMSLTMQGVLVFDGNCDLKLRMDLSRFAVANPDEDELAQMRATVAAIHEIRDAEYEM